MRVLTDTDVARDLTAEIAVAAARRALVDAYAGRLSAPPRARVELGGHDFVFTAGGYADGPVGFRAYGLWPGESDQAVLVWDGHGALTGVVAGGELGARRTGALGGVAADVLAAIHSPTADHRERFAQRARTDLGLEAEAVASARAAARGADIVVLATRSETPVVEAGWIEAGAHVSTVGPKAASAHEAPPELADAASIVATDSPDQARASDEAFFTGRPLEHLGRLVAEPPRRPADAVTLYCSTGLAGSEVVLADALLRRD